MSKKILIILLLLQNLWGLEVPIDEVEKRVFNETVSVNSQIIQLASSKSLVMADRGGKITKYLVKEGDKVRQGQAMAFVDVIAPIELTINIEPLKTELKALKSRLSIANKNYVMVKKLYEAGVESRQKMNLQEEEKVRLSSEIAIVKSKLSTLQKSKKSSKNSYAIYAGTAGVVDKILVASNAVVDANTPLLSIVKGEETFLVKSYVPLKYMNDVKVGLKGQLNYGGEHYEMMVTQILPTLDSVTQQIQLLSSLRKPVKNLFVNTYVESKLFMGDSKAYLAVKKSALSFFNNEWVVFVPEHHEDEGHNEKHEEKDAHAGHDHATHEEESYEKDNHDEHEGHGHDEEEEEVPYGIKVVKILKQNSQYVAIEGLDEHEDYVSDKSYYIKSLLLKSSLGGHGH